MSMGHQSVSLARCLVSCRLHSARLILLLPRTSSVENEIRTVLHWLDVPAMVTFKLCLLFHRCLHGSAPPYLVRYFTPVSSIVAHIFVLPPRACCLCQDFDNRIGPHHLLPFCIWNSLPVDLRDPGLSLMTFRRRLKTYLFNLFCLIKSEVVS